MRTELIRYDSMCRAIAEAHRVDEVKDLRDKATALQHYARMAGNFEAEKRCAEIRLRAERKAALLYDEQEKAKGAPGPGRGKADHIAGPAFNDVRTLADYGVSKQQMSDWRKLAAVPETRFEAALAAIEVPSLDGILRANRDAAAMHPTPRRDGPDLYPTIDVGLHVALVSHVLPILPHRRVWECAAGCGHLVDPLRAAGCEVLATDRNPGRNDITVHDFFDLRIPPAAASRVAITNPPHNLLDAFMDRGLELFDAGTIAGLVLLFRLDHLQADSRVDAFNRATFELHCNWRTEWIEGSGHVGRWSSHWFTWLKRPWMKPLYLRPAMVPPLIVCPVEDQAGCCLVPRVEQEIELQPHSSADR